jgi:hypothetical protein
MNAINPAQIEYAKYYLFRGLPFPSDDRNRSLRGGDFINVLRNIRASSRNGNAEPSKGLILNGFRLVRNK